MTASYSDPLRGVRPLFRAVVEAVVPESTRLEPDAWDEVQAIVSAALASRPPRLVRQLRLLLRVIDIRARFTTARGLSALAPASRARILRRFETSRVLLLRRGFWGLRTLALMGYYARPAAAQEIGYCGHADGWSARTAGDA